MKINHNLIRGILKWAGFTIFAISVFIKLKDIIQYGGTKKAPVDDADAPKNPSYDNEYPAVVGTDEVAEVESSDEEYDEAPESYGKYDAPMTSEKFSRN